MSPNRFVEFHVDGGVFGPNDHRSRGVYWSVLGPEMPTPLRFQDRLRYKTNNDAEWLAVRSALEYALKHYPKNAIVIYSDSKLVVNQFNEKWYRKVARHEAFFQECRALASRLPFVALKWVPRDVSVEKLGH